MIKMAIIVNGDKIRTDYHEKGITLLENSLLVRELERIKSECVKKKFELDFGVEEKRWEQNLELGVKSSRK